MLFAVFLSACSSTGTAFHEQLDPLTGVTTLRATEPLVLFQDSSARAANARDYLYLGPIEVNRMGSLGYFLWLCAWSTYDTNYAEPQAELFDSVVIYADGEPLLLDAAGVTPDAIGVSEAVYTKPVASAFEAYYPVTVDQIRLIANARDLQLRTGGSRSMEYLPWDSEDSGRHALQRFVEFTLQ